MTTIGTVAAELGLSAEALRYYEQAGLCSPGRDQRGRRDYSAFDREQLRLVAALRAVGLPIESIRQLLSAKVQGAPDRANAERALRHLTAIDDQLGAREAQLAAARALIGEWAGQIRGWLEAGGASIADG